MTTESADVSAAGNAASSATRFRLKDFEGPLDLLLFLIKKNELNIYDIPVAQITDQYLQYLRAASEFSLEDVTEFHVMAATLLYIKSRMLLPVEFDLTDEAEDPRQELVGKLIEYQRFKKLSELMEEKEREAEWFIERKKMQRFLPFAEEELIIWQQPDIQELLKTFSSLMSNLSEERILDLYEEVSVNEKITLITEFLDTRKEFYFSDLIIRKNSLVELVCAFLAILESAKIKLIVIAQIQIFGDILIRPSQNYEQNGSSYVERDSVD